MSDFFDEVTAETLGNNRTLVVIDDTGYVADDDINKLLVRSQLGYPTRYDQLNTNIIDGHAIVTSVSSQDPLTLVTTGLNSTVSGYDGVVVSSDGSVVYRGEVKEYTNTPDVLEGATFVNYGDQSWILGGYYNTSAAYSTDIWYSENGKTYKVTGQMPAYFTGRKWASAVVDSSLNIYFISGTQSDDSTPRLDIIKGSFTSGSPTITWNGSAWFSGLSEYTKAAIDTTQERIFVSEGYIDYSIAPAINAGLGTFESGNHDRYTFFIWEDFFNTLVFSDTSYRHKWTMNEARTSVIDNDTAVGTVYTHKQSSASSNWSISHNLGNTDYTIGLFDADGGPLEHSSIVKGANSLSLVFNESVNGVCFVLDGATQQSSSERWTLSGVEYEDDLWIATDDNLNRIYPASHTISGVHLELTFNEAESGWIWGYETDATSTSGIYGYYETTHEDSTTGFTNNDWHTDLSLWTGTYSTTDFVVPATIGRNKSSGNTSLSFNQSENILFKDLYCRNASVMENEQPWGTTDVIFGQNWIRPQSTMVINSTSSWYSNNYTEFTKTSLSTPAALVTSGANLGVNLPVVTALKSGYINRSIDSGESFTQYYQLGSQQLEWFGRLGNNTIDTTYKLYFYPRPSDVVWESDYGDGATDIIDDYSQAYVLLAPTIITSYSDGKITIATDSAQPSIAVEELRGKYLHLVDSSDDTTYRLKILDNSAGGLGVSINIFVDEDDLSITPSTADYVQVVHQRPDGLYYYSVITRASNFNYTIWYDGQNSIDIDKERGVTPYTSVEHFELPESIDTDNNEQLKDWFLALPLSTNIHNVSMADIDSLNTKQLQSLATDVGLIYSGLDDNTIRKLLYIWMFEVNAYGGCLDGINNIIQGIMGSDTSISASIALPSNSTGEILQIDLGDGLYTWNYTSSNLPKYSPTRDLYYMPVSVGVIDFDAREVVNHSLVHIKDRYVGTPIPIFSHSYDFSTNQVSVWSDSRLIEQYETSNSKLIVLQKTEADKLYCMLRNIKKYVPNWVTIEYV